MLRHLCIIRSALRGYLKRLFEFQVKPAEFLGFSVNVFLSNVLMVVCLIVDLFDRLGVN